MPRKPRIEYPGAVYHVMSRGDRLERIFHGAADRRLFLETLGQACIKTGWQIHAWCLMANHFHLVVETPRANLVAGMRWLLSTYTARFNRRHHFPGHLFSGRYKALIVDGSEDGYLKTVCDYVHLNPVRARLLTSKEKLSRYEWSSYRAYLGRNRPPWLRVDRLLGEYRIFKDSPAGQRQWAGQMEQRRGEKGNSQWRPIERGWCLGGEEFRQELLEKMEGRLRPNHTFPERHETEEARALRLLKAGLARLGWDNEELENRRKGDKRKLKLAERLRKETPMTLPWIARMLHMGTAGSLANALHTRACNNK